jgi:hypothetical protein
MTRVGSVIMAGSGRSDVHPGGVAMGIASEYVEAEDLLVVVWDGTVSGDEWDAFARGRLAADPEWPRGTRRLIDVTGLDPSSLTTADAEANADLYQDRTANLVGTRTAIVASRAWEVATAFERRIDRLGSTTIVFNYLAEACGWLGLDPEPARRVVTRLRRELRRER